jgi:hypothetical protein
MEAEVKSPRARIVGLYRASDAAKLTLVFDAAPPEFPDEPLAADPRQWEKLHREAFRACAVRICDALDSHIPVALTDALLAELCSRKASILRVRK